MGDVESLKQKVQELETWKKEKLVQLKKLTEDALNKTKAKFQDEIKGLEDKIEEKDSLIMSLRKENDDLKMNVGSGGGSGKYSLVVVALTDSLCIIDSGVDASVVSELNEEVKSLKSASATKEAEINKLRKELETSTSTWQVKQADYESTISELKLKQKEYESTISDLKQQLSNVPKPSATQTPTAPTVDTASIEKIDKLQSIVHELTKSVESERKEYEQEKTQFSQKIAQLQSQVSNAKEEIQAFSTERSGWERTIVTLQEKAKSGGSGDGNKGASEAKVQELQMEVQKLNKRLADEIEEKNLFEEVNRDMTQEIKEYKKKVKLYEQQGASSGGSGSGADSQIIDALKKDLEKETIERLLREEDLEQIKKELSALKQTMEDNRNDNKEIKELTVRLRALEDEKVYSPHNLN